MKTIVTFLVIGALAVFAQATTIMVDFAADSTSLPGGNALSYGSAGDVHTASALNDTTGTPTAYAVSHTGFSDNLNADASTSPSGDAAIFAGVSPNSLFGNMSAFGSGTYPLGVMTFSNLDPNLTYDIAIYSSRVSAAPIRETQVTIGTATQALDAAGNSTQLFQFAGIAPDANNEIVAEFTAGPNSNDTYEFFYLSAASITEVPEPATLGMLTLGGLALLRRRK